LRIVRALVAPRRLAGGLHAAAERSNNLKQIGLAFHNIHDSQGRFPPEGGANVNGAWGWPVALLPYLEQDGMFKVLGSPDIGSVAMLTTANLVPNNPTGRRALCSRRGCSLSSAVPIR